MQRLPRVVIDGGTMVGDGSSKPHLRVPQTFPPKCLVYSPKAEYIPSAEMPESKVV